MNAADPYEMDIQKAASFAKHLVSTTPASVTVAVAIGGALTYAAALAFDDAELAQRAANAMRLMAADLDHRAKTLKRH